MAKTKAIVLDSWAIMCYLEDEPAAEKVGKVLGNSLSNRIPLLMSVINAGEIWYIVGRRRSEKDADATIVWLREIGVKFIDADWQLTKTAATFKVKGNISYADCHAAAVAKHYKATLFTGDLEFVGLENAVDIEWL